MEVRIYDDESQKQGHDEKEKRIATFYIPNTASKEWVEENVPPLIRVVQLLMGTIDKTGY